MGGGVAWRGVVWVSIAALSGACGGPNGATGPSTDAAPATAAPGSPAAPPVSAPPGAAWDPSSLDPRIDVLLTGSPSCAAVGPRDPAPSPVRIVRPSTTSCGSAGATSDGLGDVAVACLDGTGDRGWNEVFSRDGNQHATLAGWTLAAPTDSGFAAAYRPFGARTARQGFVWFDSGAWQSSSDPDTSSPMRFVFSRPGKGTLEIAWTDGSGNGATTRWVDAHGNPLRPALAWPAAVGLGVGGIDDLGRALLTYGSATSPGTSARWLDRDDVTGTELQVPAPDGWEPLSGGGLVQRRTFVLRSGSTALEPAPAWLAAHTEPMTIVNGNRAYAFVTDANASQGCVTTVSLVATDGTSCGTITLTAQTGCPQRTSIGPDGTLIQLVPTLQPDPGSVWRWWSGYLR